MRTSIKPLSLGRLEEPLLEHGYRQFLGKGPDVNAFMTPEFSPLVQVLFDDRNLTPRYMYVGPEGLAAQKFGKTFAHGAPNTRGLPNKTFGRSLGGRYFEVSQLTGSGAPAADRIVAELDGEVLEFDRLLLPTRHAERVPTFVVLLSLRKTLRVQTSPCAEG